MYLWPPSRNSLSLLSETSHGSLANPITPAPSPPCTYMCMSILTPLCSLFSRCSARCIHHARCLHTRLGSTRLAPRLARACPNVRTAHDHVKRDCFPAAAVTPPSGVSRIAPALALPRIYPPRMAAGMYIAAELSPHAALCTRSRTFAHARLSRCDFPKHTFICTSLPHLTSSS
ncbi:hypothetical protein C8J57DRAFT_1312547 [Mycena rebaudengoi]|nr:hypothetical protein C8J57DRAFT_1312547 [Mycena rebaudengoi]